MLLHTDPFFSVSIKYGTLEDTWWYTNEPVICLDTQQKILWLPYSYRSIAKAIVVALLRPTTTAIAIVGRVITLEGEPSKKKQRNDTKKNANKIKSDNFRSKREKSNSAMAILEIFMIEWHHNYFVFWW